MKRNAAMAVTPLLLAAALAPGIRGFAGWSGPVEPVPTHRASQETDPSVLRVPLPSAYLSGYAGDIRGEVLSYHSPVPTIGTSLLVRSEDRGRSIAWESQPVPEGLHGDGVTFALMVGIDVNDQPRRFDFRVNGLDVFRFSNPLEAARGDTLVWAGEVGVRGEFVVTLMDRYGDAMGFLFLTVPRGMVQLGQPVRFEVLGESAGARTWFMVFRDPLEPHILVQNAPAVLRTPGGGEAQVVRLDLLAMADGQRFVLESPIGSVDSVVAMGHSRFTLPVPAVERPREVPLRISLGDYGREVAYAVTPPRRMEIHLHHHTHLDIGYTHHQDEVVRLQWAHLEEALRLGEESQDFPDGSRFVWIPEGIWPVDTYLRAHPGEKSERLLEGIRRGWIELDGMYAGLLTGLANEETLLHSFDAGMRLSRMSGVPIRSEMLSDIPGFTWGLVEAMARNGIRYLSIGPNFGHRIGHFTEELGDRPFWWEGPSGENKVLAWVSGGGYAWFHTGLGYDSITAVLDEEKIFRYVDQLVAGGYPYDLTYLRYNIGSDNGPPDPGLARAVRSWNQRYSSPVLRISGMTETFREFEERYGNDLPTYRGDLTGYWEDGAASSARETAMTRRVAESLVQTEKLAGMRGVTLAPDSLGEAWRNVLLFYEHTWGSWNSISEPYSELTLTSWEKKREFAERAAELADRLRAAALDGEETGDATGGDAENDVAAPGGGGDETGARITVEVFNTLTWERSGLVVLSPEASAVGDRVREVGGGPAPSQRLAGGELAFLARDVPGEGRKVYRLEAGEQGVGEDRGAAHLEAGGQEVTGGDGPRETVSTTHYSVGVDDGTGGIVSLRDRSRERELVDSRESGLAQYIYVPGRDPATAVRAGDGRVEEVEAGPLVHTLRFTTRGEGLKGPVVTEVRLVEGLDRVDLKTRVPKAWVLDPEAAFLRFPFAMADPEVRLDVPFGSFRPEADQVPGASKNYFSLQRWIDVSDGEGGVTLTSVDAPLIQVGAIRTDAIVTGWLEVARPSPILYSYLMNNYWETNYRAAQDDEVEFRYALRAHGPFQEAEADRFGLEVARPLVARITRR